MGLPAITRPVPDPAAPPLKFKIKSAAPAAGAYATGTPEFRYWAAAEALRRCADFWAPILALSRWQPGATLKVGLDEGVELNAYYDRKELAFFHQPIKEGTVVYSGESPDVLCHEMGHACLDAHRPQLFDAPFIEVAAFHESFGDMSAILCALQLPSVRAAAMADLKAGRSSALSRVAEQLGWAIRQESPDSVDPNCLRDACNSFQYVDPNTLPFRTPASQLSSEAHSFSRIFTGAFHSILSGMLAIRSSTPRDSDLAGAAADAARLLASATAVGAAPVQPTYYAQVASHMIDADTADFGGKYRSVLARVFVDRKILPPAAVQPLLRSTGKLAIRPSGFAAAGAKDFLPARASFQTFRLPARGLGMSGPGWLVEAPLERRPFLQVAASVLPQSADSATMVEQAASQFARMLVANGRVATARATGKARAAGIAARDTRRKSHELVRTPDGPKLVRLNFD